MNERSYTSTHPVCLHDMDRDKFPIFKRKEVIGQWIKLHNDLFILFSLPNIIRVIRWRRMSLLELVDCSGGSLTHM